MKTGAGDGAGERRGPRSRAPALPEETVLAPTHEPGRERVRERRATTLAGRRAKRNGSAPRPVARAVSSGCDERPRRHVAGTAQSRYQVFARRDALRPPDADAGVDGDAAVGQGEDRVEVELGDRRQVLAEAGEPEHEVGERVRRPRPARRGSRGRAGRPCRR